MVYKNYPHRDVLWTIYYRSGSAHGEKKTTFFFHHPKEAHEKSPKTTTIITKKLCRRQYCTCFNPTSASIFALLNHESKTEISWKAELHRDITPSRSQKSLGLSEQIKSLWISALPSTSEAFPPPCLKSLTLFPSSGFEEIYNFQNGPVYMWSFLENLSKFLLTW